MSSLHRHRVFATTTAVALVVLAAGLGAGHTGTDGGAAERGLVVVAEGRDRAVVVGRDAAVAAAQVPGDEAGGDDGDPAPWRWPSSSRVVVRPWQAPETDYGAGHRGIDVDATVGEVVRAVDDGVVAFAGAVGGRAVVTIDHGDGLVSTLDSVTPSVVAGAVVRRGDPVGRVAVGHCPATVPCLHIGARVDGRYVNPTPWLPGPAWPVLLPDAEAVPR